MGACDLDDDGGGSINGETLGETELVFVRETSAAVMSTLARVVFLLREERRDMLLTRQSDELGL